MYGVATHLILVKHLSFRVLQECKYLKFFDVSFCSDLDDEWCRSVKERYPHVDIKKSVQYG